MAELETHSEYNIDLFLLDDNIAFAMSSKSNLPERFLRGEREQLVASANERLILDLIRRQGEMTRADLTRVTDLTAQSVMRLVDDLIARGLLRFGATVSVGRGKPSPVVQLVPDFAFCAGVSIATDAVTLVLVNFAGAIVAQRVEPMAPITRETLIAFLKPALARLFAATPGARERLFGIGVAMTGFFIGKGTPLNPPQPLDDLALIEIDTFLERELGFPVWIDNDGNAAAIGESLLGHGREYRHFAYLYFSHGFGGGLVSSGECLRGVHGNAGEFAGMLPMQGLPRPTLELLREMRCEDGHQVDTIHAMLAQFDPDWPCVERWIVAVAPSMALVASAIIAIVDPELIVLGGRMPRALADKLIPHIRIDNLPRRGVQRPQALLVAAEARGDAAAIGAAAAPLKRYFFL